MQIRLSGLIRYLEIQTFSSAIEHVQQNYTFTQFWRQISHIDLTNVSANCCSNGTGIQILLDAEEILAFVRSPELNGEIGEMFGRIRAFMESSFVEFVSQTLTLLTEVRALHCFLFKECIKQNEGLIQGCPKPRIFRVRVGVP